MPDISVRPRALAVTTGQGLLIPGRAAKRPAGELVETDPTN